MLINGYITIQQVNDLSFVYNLTGTNTFVLRGLTTQFVDSTHVQVNAGACLINGVLIELTQNVIVPFNSQNVTSPTVVNGQYNLVISMQQTQLNTNFSSQGIYPYSVFLQFELTPSTNEIVLATVQWNNTQITSLTQVPLPTFLSLINASAPNITNLQNIVNNILTSSGFNSNGTYQAPTNAGQLSQATSLTSADLALYNMISSILNNITTIQKSAGLNNTGQYVPNVNTNYIATATSLNNADVLLDNSIKTVTNSLQNFENAVGTQIQNLNTSINNINTATGISSTSQYIPNNNTTYIKSATSLNNADVLLDTQLNTLSNQLNQEISTRTSQNTTVENQISAIQTSSGLSSTGKYVANANANYIKSATSLNNADFLLDSALYTVSNSLSNLSNSVTSNSNIINNIITASGLTSIGTYTPAPTGEYISSATSLASATELLNNAITSVNDSLTSFENNLASPNGATLVGVNQPFVNAPKATNVQSVLASFDTTFLTTAKKFTYTATVSGTTFTISHNLNNSSPVVFVYSNGTQINPTSITIVDANNITVTFSTSVQPTIVVIG
jgi:hypothetical protein